MQAGNAFYKTPADMPRTLPILSLASVMLLPGGFVPLTISESGFIQMIDDAMRGNRLIGLILVKTDSKSGRISANDNNSLWDVGCIGRITNYSEVGDGQVLISLQGVCRFRLGREIAVQTPYRQFQIEPFSADFDDAKRSDEIDRDTFLAVFRDYLEINEMQADWDTIAQVSNETLVNALSIIVPFEPAEKQALLEAPDLKTRSETMIAIAQRAIMTQGKDKRSFLQ